MKTNCKKETHKRSEKKSTRHNVSLPQYMSDYVRRNCLSLSKILQMALTEKMRNKKLGNNGNNNLRE